MASTPSTFAPVFTALRPLLARHAGKLVVVHDTPEHLYLDTAHVMPNKKPMFFGAVTVKRGFVSFYLMPVYVFPELLASMSPALQKRMQGKSCFNFKKVEPELFEELGKLTDAGYAAFQRAGYVPA